MKAQNQTKYLKTPSLNGITSKVRACFQNTHTRSFESNKNIVIKTSGLSFGMLASVGVGLLASSGSVYAGCDNYAPTTGQTVTCSTGTIASPLIMTAGVTDVTVNVEANAVTQKISLGTGGTVNNSGKIEYLATSGSNLNGVILAQGGTLTNTASGIIRSSSGQGIVLTGAGVIDNAGSISGSGSGVYIVANAQSSVVNNRGTISTFTQASNAFGAVFFGKTT